MKNTIGSPVYGDGFMFRTKEVRKGLRYMKNGNSFLMLGIRRTGKSSVLKQIAYELKKENKDNICIELDCGTYHYALNFYKALYDKLPSKLQKKWKKLLEDSKQLPSKVIDLFTDNISAVEVPDLAKVSFRDQLRTYQKPFEKIVNEFFKENNEVYLFLDELPFLFENILDKEGSVQEIKTILINLRNWRDAGVPMGITGSLNLHLQMEHNELSRKLLAGLNTIQLQAFTKEEATQLIDALLEKETQQWWTSATTEKLLELLPDYVPYFVQYAYNEVVVSECATTDEVEEVFHNDIMPGLFKDFIYQFEERLKVFDAEQLQSAMSILDQVAQKEHIKLQELQQTIEKAFDYKVLLKLLDNEFITLSGAQAYQFTLNIIRNWWKEKRGL